MPRWFSAQDLVALDALTANNASVLASLGGRPAKMKEYAEGDEYEEEGGVDSQMGRADGTAQEEDELMRHRTHEAVRQRMGSIHRAPLHKTLSRRKEHAKEENCGHCNHEHEHDG
jgi:hypothetical protein